MTDQTQAVIAVDGGTWGHVTALPGQKGVVSVGMPQSTVSYSVTITTEALKDWASRYNRHGIIRKP